MSNENLPGVGGLHLPARRTDGETLEDRLTSNAYDQILPARYLQRNENGEIVEEPEELFERVAKNIAVAELAHHEDAPYIDTRHIKPDHPRKEELCDEVFGEGSKGSERSRDECVQLSEENAQYVSFDVLANSDDYTIPGEVWEWMYEYQRNMENLDFMPNTPTLINAGSELQQLSACFVISPEDDMTDIHETGKEAAQVFQSGGGTGYAFSNLRPFGDTVGSTGGIASGPLTFMETFDQICETVQQGGVRRGAQMGVMSVEHPDVPFFIHAKNKVVSLAQTLKLNDPDDPTHSSFSGAIEEARGVLEEHTDDEGRVEPFLRNAVEGYLSNFNISVAVTDEFMETLKSGGEWTFTNPRTEEPHIATEETKELFSWFGWGEHVTVGEPVSMPAEKLWTAIVDGAHENGEPGVIYIDRVNNDHGFDVEENPEYEVQATNPCGEQPLVEYEACNLGHINLSTLMNEDSPTLRQHLATEPMDGGEYVNSEEAIIGNYLDQSLDLKKIERLVQSGTRFLDNVVTMSDFPVERISETVASNRKVGLGVMGLAQMFIQMGVPYGSEWGNVIAKQVMTRINRTSKQYSHLLANERGNFSNWEDSKYADPENHAEWFEKHTGKSPESYENGYAMRNYSTTTIAPTGTTSMIGNTTGGCEPIFNVAYYKNVTDDIQGDEMLVEFDDYFLEVLEANNYDVEAIKEETQELMQNNDFDGISSVDSVPDSLAELFVTTNELSGIEHAGVQVACQKGVDSGISKTVNAPNEATVDDAKSAFEYIYTHGGKSVTYYRDGSRTKQVMTTRQDNQDVDSEEGENPPESSETVPEVSEGAIPRVRERPDTLQSTTERITTPQGGLYATISVDDRGPFEMFGQIGKSGGYTQSMIEAIARLVSLNLRQGGDPEDIVDQLGGIRGPNVSWDNGEQVHSVPDAMALALDRHMNRTEELTIDSSPQETQATTDGGESMGSARVVDTGNPTCEKCDSELAIEEGCKKCYSCGWSAC